MPLASSLWPSRIAMGTAERAHWEQQNSQDKWGWQQGVGVPLTPPMTNKGGQGTETTYRPTLSPLPRGAVTAQGVGEALFSSPTPTRSSGGTAAVQVGLVAGHPRCPCGGPHGRGSEEAPTHGTESSVLPLWRARTSASPPRTVPGTRLPSHQPRRSAPPAALGSIPSHARSHASGRPAPVWARVGGSGTPAMHGVDK